MMNGLIFSIVPSADTESLRTTKKLARNVVLK